MCRTAKVITRKTILTVISAAFFAPFRERIRASLRRIETNQYGFCHECKTPIGVQRLLVDPCALFCQECALYKEREAAEEAKRSLHQGRPLKRR